MEKEQTTCAGQKVLLVTGDKTFGESVNQKLLEIGYTSSLVSDGVAGWKAVNDTLPHLLLLDIELTGMSGYELLGKKHAEPLLAKIPVFFMSTQGVPINMREVPQGSVAEFIVSIHAEPDEVVKRVNSHFGCVPVVPSATPKAAGRKILWVEDDKLIGNILGKKLMTSGFDLTLAKNGEQAMQELEKGMPDAILIDLLLPGMSGFEILQTRSHDNLKDVPVMVLSNLSKPSDIERTRILGAQKFMVKATASLDQIVAEVNNLIKK